MAAMSAAMFIFNTAMDCGILEPPIIMPSGKFKMADGGGNVEAEREFSDNDNQRETDDEKLERQYFWKVVEAFLYYK